MSAGARADVIVIGGGIAGASCAWFLSRDCRVLLLEREDHFGWHATGRSAALFSEYFGNPPVRALTAASRAFFETPPEGFCAVPLVSPRGVVALATAQDVEAGRLEAALAGGREAVLAPTEISLDDARSMCPVLDPRGHAAAVFRPSVMDIDTDALHQGFLRGIRARGGVTLASIAVRAIDRQDGQWVVSTGTGKHTAPLLLNAAGAWADEMAGLANVAPIGLVPKRRTVAVVDLPDPVVAQRPLHAWPMVTDLADSFYFKPEGGKLMVCPCDATPCLPCDARPEELDTAVAIARLEAVTTLSVRRVAHGWAGLRSFVADDMPVLGEAPDAPGFFWAAALGGYGMQTAPAVGHAVASLLTQGCVPDWMRSSGLTAAMFSPARCTETADTAADRSNP